MSKKTYLDNNIPTVSSSIANRTVEMKLRTLMVVAVTLIMIGLSFYGGYLYGTGDHHTAHPLLAAAQQRFAIGLVVFISPSSITISNQNNTGTQTFYINKKTLVSINGQKSNGVQIKGGDVVLIRESKNNPSIASVILVNSHFSE